MVDRNRSFETSLREDENRIIIDGGRDRYLAICLGGLQSVVKTLVEGDIEACGWNVDVQLFREDVKGAETLVNGVHNGQAGCGKLLLTTNAPPAILKGLRCLQALYALVAHAESLDIVIQEAPRDDNALLSKEDPKLAESLDTAREAQEHPGPAGPALARLESLVAGSAMWPAAINVWRRFRAAERRVSGSVDSEADQAELSRGEGEAGDSRTVITDVTKLKYRVSVIRDGKHPFKSVEASPRLGGAVWDVNPAWSVDLTEYDIEVVAFILERSVAVGLSLGNDRAKHSSNGRVPKEYKSLEVGKRVSSLRPSTAYLMLKLADPNPGDVVLDCMCGIGTIPFLGAEWFPGMIFLGGEVDPNAIDHLKQNRQSAPFEATTVAGSDACAWDVQSLPLRDGTVDAIVVDMPFGVSCGTPRLISKLYPSALTEMARVLRPGSGRAVLLVAQPYLLGLPEIRRERRKKSDPAMTKGPRGHSKHLDSGSASQEHKGNQGAASSKGVDSARDETGPGKGSDCFPRGRQDQSKDVHEAKAEGFRHTASTPKGIDGETQYGKGNPRSGEHGVLWRVKERRPVNVGGLVSWLVILDRTEEASPQPRPDRRRRWIGLHGYCKRRKEKLDTTA